MNPEKFEVYPVGANDDGKRVENVVSALLGTGYGLLHKAFRKGDIRLNGVKTEPGTRCKAGDTLAVYQGLIRAPLTPPEPAPAQKKGGPSRLNPAWILYESTQILCLNKPAGFSSQGPGSLEDLVRDYLAPKIPPSLSFHPGPLHRLDQNTTGVLCYGVSVDGARIFSRLQQEKQLEKYYTAVLKGVITKPLVMDQDLVRDKTLSKTHTAAAAGEGLPKGQEALSLLTPLMSRGGLTLARVQIKTGRTHQIRAHCAAQGYPLWGDSKYGGGPGPFFLHALELIFPDKALGVEKLQAPLPPAFSQLLAQDWGLTPADFQDLWEKSRILPLF